ncbi:AMP-binding enzyme [Siccirubricoccus phaeus]|uniref:AMP-binding enzyme n=1 Tax=Siccirubricoccus phaeus TaxID=2595053 RepID=UPI00165B9BE3|nr:hypothetical protein [Siccirubricoccus phaeus]
MRIVTLSGRFFAAARRQPDKPALVAEAGYLFFLGRSKEVIVTGGINVIPADVELALVDDPQLVEAAAFAVPRLGEVAGLACVSARPEEFDLRRLRRHVGRRLANDQQPRKFLALPALPRNAMGKPRRHVLLDLYLAAEGQSA